MTNKLDITIYLGTMSFFITLLAAWFTHVIVCIKSASWLFLIAGAIAFPVAWIHGIGYWFGLW